MPYKKPGTKEEVLQKLRHYCGYQERCHHDVIEKLYSLGIQKANHDEIVSTLIEEKYLNEERFAISFAGGKFRIKKWGRVKIKNELRRKMLSDYCISKALKEIDKEEYEQTLHDLAGKKFDGLEEEPAPARKKKTSDYLIQKGFEPGLVYLIVNKLGGKN